MVVSIIDCRHDVNQALQNGTPYYPVVVKNDAGICCVVLVAYHSFPFDFLFLVKHRPSLRFFDGINIYFANPLHDARRVFSNIVYINLCIVLTCQQGSIV